MPKSTPPLDLLRELRKVFTLDANQHREREETTLAAAEKRLHGARAYACENVVREIDATLRDWS